MQRAISRYVVSRVGQFVRLDDSVAQTRSMDSLLSPLVDRVAAMNPSMAASMKAELSGSVRNGAASGWKTLSAFAARTWARGDSTIDTVRQAIPGLQGAEMIVTTVLRYAGTTPCPTYVTVRTCWRFTTRSGSDMSSMRASLAAMLAKSGIDDASIVDRMPIPVTSSDGYMVVDAETSRPLELGTNSNTVSSGTIGETPFSASARIRMVSEYHWRPL